MKTNIDFDSFRSLPVRAHIFWKDKYGRYLGGNDLLLEKLGFASHKDLLGKIDYDLPVMEAGQFVEEDQLVMQRRVPIQFVTRATFPTSTIDFLNIKTPMFDKHNQVIGIFGFASYMIEHDKLHTELLSTVFPKNTIFSSLFDNQTKDNFIKFPLTKRERICLYYLIRGKTAREVAAIMFISKRTVEKHIANMKDKLHCKTISELICKTIENE